jgi:hypothetical protein
MRLDENVRALVELADKASPGPWHTFAAKSVIHVRGEGEKGTYRVASVDALNGRDDAEFIAAARAGVPWLCAQLLEAIEILTEFATKEQHAERVAAFLAGRRAHGE